MTVNTRKLASTTLMLMVASILGLTYATPYLVEVSDVGFREETHIPEDYILAATVKVRNNAPLNVRVEAALIMHCELMNGSQVVYRYPFNSIVVNPYSTEVLEITVSFKFTTPENPKAIYSYSADVIVVVKGVISSRVVEVRSVHNMDG